MVTSTPLGLRTAAFIVRRASVSTVQQAIAFDAIGMLVTSDAEAWRRVFLRHATTFAVGASAPDDEFHDFKNHLLFPSDGNWGGAAAKAQCWYTNLVAALRKQEWRNAVYCAGVLSHYVSDASHPFHTAQSAADNDIYAALDLSTWVMYATLARLNAGPADAPRLAIAGGGNGLGEALKAGARFANDRYAGLLAHFDLSRAVADPATGLDAEGRIIMAETIGRATSLIAAVFDSAIAEAAVPPPVVSLGASSLLALISWPVSAFLCWRRTQMLLSAVRDMASEVNAEGHARQTLPVEVRIKRDLYAKEVLAASTAKNVVAFERKRGRAQGIVETKGEVLHLRRDGAPGARSHKLPPVGGADTTTISA